MRGVWSLWHSTLTATFARVRHFIRSLVARLQPIFTAALLAHGDAEAAQPRGGPHDFDFELGRWRVHHRVKRDGHWTEFEGTSATRALVDGSAVVEENTFFRPAGTSYGIAIRAYDAKTAQWAIWWIDGRNPHAAMDPPVVGRFVDGVGTFYSDAVVDGKTIRTRYLWSQITAKSARWEQALSSDRGETWETNWVMEFRRVE